MAAGRATPKLTAISLGAGVQSTTMALLAKHGVIAPMPDCAIFADTGEEPAAVYRHLAWLMGAALLPFPVLIARAWEGYGRERITGPLGDEILRATRGHSAGLHSRPPLFTLNTDGTKGMIRRQCTGDYKLDVIRNKTRELLGLKKRQRWPKSSTVEQWIGISTDEASRMKPSQLPAVRSRWPLIELGMSREDCLAWLERQGYPRPPKSACTFCPFHSDAEWRRIRAEDPAGWRRAVKIDKAIRTGLASKGLDSLMFLHASRRPLSELGESGDIQINLFENECEGMCGV